MKIMIGKYEASIYPEGGGFTGAVSCGFDATGRRLRVKRNRQHQGGEDRRKRMSHESILA